MARVAGPSRRELDTRGDEFAARVSRAIRTTLRDVAASARDVDDLARIQTVWRSVVTRALAPHLRAVWNVAVKGVRRQLEEINERERASLLAAVFEIPKVSSPLAESFLADAENRLVAIGDLVWYTARGEMLTGLQLGEGVAELKDRVIASASVSAKRAEVIARTEVNSAMNNGAYQQMKALDVATVKEWIATDDTRTRESHAEVDGEEIAGDAKFMVGGHPMDHPHDLNAPPSETISCRCTLAWEIIDDEDDYEVELVAAGMRCASFHLPGKHQQKNHGNRYHKPGDKSSGLKKQSTQVKTISPEGQRVLDFIKDDTKQPLPANEANGHWYSAFDNPNFLASKKEDFDDAVKSEKADDARHPGYIQSDDAKAWLPIKKVDPSTLIHTQNWLRQIDLTQDVSAKEGDREAIVVYRADDGTRYLTNGHHRVSLALAKGLDEIEVREATSSIDVPSVVSPRRHTPRNELHGNSAVFHLPGRHEQKKHGNRKSKKVAADNGASTLDSIRSNYDARVTQAAREDDVFDATGIRDKRALYKRIRQNDDVLGGIEGDIIRSSINDYVNAGYTKYNTELRESRGKEVSEGARAIDAAIDESPLSDDVVMWRGVLDPSVTFGSAWKSNGDNSGLTYVDHGYSSLSAYEDVADNFSTRYGMDTNGVKMRILIPKGKKLLGVEQNIEDEANSEGELLGQRGLKFRVVRDYTSPGPKKGTTVRTLDVEVID